MDPLRIQKTDGQLQANRDHLISICQNLLDHIFQSVDQCPLEIREVCHHFVVTVSSKFAEYRYQAVGGFIFLRFFCPACVAPDGFGLITESPSSPARRSLVLVAKILQNLASGVLFGGKEEFMSSINPFIESNLAATRDFFKKISEVPFCANETEKFLPLDVMPMKVLEDLVDIHRYLNDRLSKMIGSIGNTDIPSIIRRFQPPERTPIEKLCDISPEQLVKLGALKTKKNEQRLSRHLKPSDLLSRMRLTPYIWNDGNVVVLNRAEEAVQSLTNEGNIVKDPLLLSSDLLERILVLYVKHSFLQKKSNKQITNWKELEASEAFKQFVALSTSLRSVDLSKLSYLERLVFLLNVSNTLALHIHVVVECSSNGVRRRNHFFTMWTYLIGEDKYSLNCIRNGILRGNRKVGFAREFQSADRRVRYALSKLDPRIHFALSYLHISSPKVRIFRLEEIEEQLQESGVEFCREHITVDLKKKEVLLPEMFHKYSMDFAETRDQMLIWLFQFLKDQQKTNLFSLIESKNFSVASKPYNWSLNTSSLEDALQYNFSFLTANSGGSSFIDHSSLVQDSSSFLSKSTQNIVPSMSSPSSKVFLIRTLSQRDSSNGSPAFIHYPQKTKPKDWDKSIAFYGQTTKISSFQKLSVSSSSDMTSEEISSSVSTGLLPISCSLSTSGNAVFIDDVRRKAPENFKRRQNSENSIISQSTSPQYRPSNFKNSSNGLLSDDNMEDSADSNSSLSSGSSFLSFSSGEEITISVIIQDLLRSYRIIEEYLKEMEDFLSQNSGNNRIATDKLLLTEEIFSFVNRLLNLEQGRQPSKFEPDLRTLLVTAAQLNFERTAKLRDSLYHSLSVLRSQIFPENSSQKERFSHWIRLPMGELAELASRMQIIAEAMGYCLSRQ